MIQLGNTVISEDIIEKQFVCDLNKCKGACCVEGNAGAPLSKQEAEKLEAIFENVKPFLRPEGIKAIEEQGTSVVGSDLELETTLVDGNECAYVIFDKHGITKCGIEKAWEQGKVDFKKPVSCHLYPIRITEYKSFSAVNYHKWPICSDACALGDELKVPVYKFVKDALVRKFGKKWFDEFDQIAKAWKSQNR